MATFEDQVNGLTNLSIGSSSTDPGQTELSTFLKDGVIDVTSRCISARPQDIENFQRESSTIDSNGGLDLGGAKIISVIREANADGSSDGTTVWENCRKVSASMQSSVVDTTSLMYSSKYNPVYIIDDNNKINVYPVASSNNGYKVYYVNNVPTDETNEVTLTHAHSDIKWFPNDKVYLVVLYASIQSLQAALASKSLPSDITFPSIPSPLSLSSVPNLPSLSGDSVSFTTTAPTYSGPTVVPNFGDAENWISVEEDPEMLAGRIQTINSQIGEFQAKVQDSVQSFNKENAEYQAQLQVSIQNAQLSSKNDANKLQKYSAEISSYQQDNQSKIAKFNSDLQSYTSEVSNKLQDYSAKIQKAVVDYGWMEARAKTLNEQYNNAFVAMAGSQPKAQPAPQPQRQYRR